MWLVCACCWLASICIWYSGFSLNEALGKAFDLLSSFLCFLYWVIPASSYNSFGRYIDIVKKNNTLGYSNQINSVIPSFRSLLIYWCCPQFLVGSRAGVWSWSIPFGTSSKCRCCSWRFPENVIFSKCWISMFWTISSSTNNTALLTSPSSSGITLS